MEVELEVCRPSSIACSRPLTDNVVLHRQEAFNDLMRSAYYRSWDPRVIRAYVEFALITLPDGTVRTKSHPVLGRLPALRVLPESHRRNLHRRA